MIAVVVVAKLIGYFCEYRGETPVQRAHRICRECGMKSGAIDQIIENVRDRGLTRAEEIELFDSTFKPTDTHRDACEPCVQAVLDAAGIAETMTEP